MSEDPIGFSAGDLNLSRYVGNSPVNATDPSGLTRRVGDYVVQGKGHHIIPVELWKEFGFAPELYPMLDKYGLIKRLSQNSRPQATRPRPESGAAGFVTGSKTLDHNYTGHGSKTGYTGFLRAELRERLAAYMRNNNSKRLSILEQQEFIKKFIDDVRNGKVTRKFIVDFNKQAANGSKALRKWLKENRHRYPKFADEVSPIAIKGLRKIDAGKARKIVRFLGGSTKFLSKKFLPLVRAIMVYNNARAAGKSRIEALAIAGLEEVNPCPVGYEEFEAAGKQYRKAWNWAMDNNVHGGRGGRLPTDDDGFPIGRKRKHYQLPPGFEKRHPR